MSFTGDIVRQTLYILFGAIGMASNSFVLAICIKSKQLHFNAYHLAAALATTDVLGGFAFVVAGAFRLHLVLTNETQLLIAPWECIYVPSASLFVLAYHAGPMMIVLISLDRLLAVTAIRFYFDLGRRYTMGLITFCLVYTLTIFGYWTYDMMYMTPRVPSVTKFCWGIYTESVHLYDYYAPPALVSASVLVMIATLLVLRFRSSGIQQSSSSNNNDQSTLGNNAQLMAAVRNAKAARLLAFVSFNTFAMWVVPEMFVAIIDAYGYGEVGWFVEVAPVMWMLQPLHGLTNLLIYFRRGSQFRKAFGDLRNRVRGVGNSTEMIIRDNT